MFMVNSECLRNFCILFILLLAFTCLFVGMPNKDNDDRDNNDNDSYNLKDDYDNKSNDNKDIYHWHYYCRIL